MDAPDQPNSICHIQSIHMYPLPSTDQRKLLPFALLTGETVVHSGTSVDGPIVITNYRLCVQFGEAQHHIPLGLVELVEIRELFYLQIGCKDARTFRCTFENNENAQEWYDRITKAAEPPRQLDQLFAFYHCVWSIEKGGEAVACKLENQRKYVFDKKMFEAEMKRLQFQGDSWRISKANENYKLCPTYPPYLLVPSCINDEMLESVAKFRSSRRIPAAVWRHSRNGAVIARCSQPEVGWLGWRSGEDEDLLRAVSEACSFDGGLKGAVTNGDRDSDLSHSPGSIHSDESLQIAGEVGRQEKKVLIMDARSYTTAFANRARGGGCECPEYYPNCEIQFMNLANIHSIRKSFHALRQLCTASAEQQNWFSQLENTRWLLHMSGLMKAAVTLSTAVERDARPVVVHCSDGWDRTPQIVALAELLLDPYYRTIDGFRVLIEREWLAFGHKFADRCGHSTGSDDQNERCPVFLQWLDCVHQLVVQFPCAFEFSMNYLVKLVQHTYSNFFGTFLCNTQKQRSKFVIGKTFSVWEFLGAPYFRNQLYAPLTTSKPGGNKVLWPQTNVRDLRLWSEVYLGSLEANFYPEGGSAACPGPPGAISQQMAKTRSYGDLVTAENGQAQCARRSSDPNINRDGALKSLENAVATAAARERLPSSTSVDYPSSDLEDSGGCSQDCIFKGGGGGHPLDNGLDLVESDAEDGQPNGYANGLVDDDDEDDSIVIRNGGGKTDAGDGDADADNNDAGRRPTGDGDDYDGATTDGTDSADGIGDVVGKMLDMERSQETSTETLVSENLICSASPKEYNGFEKIQSPLIENGGIHLDGCKMCAQNPKMAEKNNSDPRQRLSQYSRLSNSSNSWDNTLHAAHRVAFPCHQRPLGEDGLVTVRSQVQERLDQIVEEQRRKVELLEKELYLSRQILIKQACHKCSRADSERQDDNSDSDRTEESTSVRSFSKSKSRTPKSIGSPPGSRRPSSTAESAASAGESRASAAGESLRSDPSWVAVEEAALADCRTTLWEPDHAVTRCTGCGTEFWLGRRRHHCRKCGKIFCADCSENSTPVPSEQLYNPVRVCTGCYTELRRSEPPNRCKRPGGGGPAANPQITASSN